MTPMDVKSELVHGDGYVVLPGLIPPDEAERLRGLVLEEAERRRQAGSIIIQHGRVRVGVLALDPAFLRLALRRELCDLADALLGPPEAVLAGFSAHIVPPGVPPQGVHVDYPYFAMEQPFPEQPLQMQLICALEDFCPANGCTRVLAGTQTLRRMPDVSRFWRESQPIELKAGDAIVSHGALWHDTSTNRTLSPRVALLGSYTPFWIRSIEGVPEIARTMPDLSERDATRLGLRYLSLLQRSAVVTGESAARDAPY